MKRRGAGRGLWWAVSRGTWYAAAGFVMTWVVAWGLAAFLPLEGWRRLQFFVVDDVEIGHPNSGVYRALTLTQEHTFGAEMRLWYFGIRPAKGRGHVSMGLQWFEEPWKPHKAVDRPPWINAWIPWGQARKQSVKSIGSAWPGAERRFGWPLPSSWHAIGEDGDQQHFEHGSLDWLATELGLVPTSSLSGMVFVAGGLPIRPSTWAPLQGMYTVRALPLHPIWPGVAINTVFWGGCVWGLVMLAGWMRRVRRKRRGLCISCGYSLAGLGGGACPECGGAGGVAHAADGGR